MYTHIVTLNIPSSQVTVKRYEPKHLEKTPAQQKRTRNRRKSTERIANRIVNIALTIAIIFSAAACFSGFSSIFSNPNDTRATIVSTARASYNAKNQYQNHSDTTTSIASKPDDVIRYTGNSHNKTDDVEPTKTAEVWKTMDIPASNTGQKTFMDYKTITNTSSKQYAMQQSAHTNDVGLRCYNDYYMVAMGTYYGTVGDVFRVTFESGTTIQVIMGDVKSDNHTDELHQHRNGNIVEFIVDGDFLPDEVWYHGDVSYINNNFAGKVVSIEKLMTNTFAA